MASGSKKWRIRFSGMMELSEKIDKLEGSLNNVVESALKASFYEVTPGIKKAIAPHRQTGETENSLVKTPNIDWTGKYLASMEIGFDIENGGLPSIFLMYGTPRHMAANQYGEIKEIKGVDQDMNLLRSVHGSAVRKRVEKLQKEVFQKHLQRVMK